MPKSANASADSPSDRHTSRRRYQFGIRTLLVVTVLVAVLCGALSGMLGRSGGTPISASLYVALAIMAPVGVMIVFSLLSATQRRK